jgi:PAS domain S-box-containing protein
MLNVKRSSLLRYGVAVGSVVLALLLTHWLWPFIRPQSFSLFFAAVTFSAWYGGLGPALSATFLAAWFSTYFISSTNSPRIDLEDILRLAVFVLVALLISSLSAQLQAARRRAEAIAQEAQRHQENSKQNEERFRLLVDNVLDYAIIIVDPNGYVESWGAGAETILGYQAAEIIGENCSRFFIPEDIQQDAPEEERNTARTKGRAEDERWHLRKDGTCFWGSGIMTALRDEAGNLRGFVKLFRDLTERKRIEEAKQRNSQRIELLSETAGQLLLNDQPQALINSLYDKLSSHLDLEVYFNYLVTEDGQLLQLNSYRGVPEQVAQEMEYLEIGQAVCGSVALERHPIIVENIQESSDPLVELLRSLGITAYACHPLLAHGRLIGTLSFGTRKRSQFDLDELALLQTVCNQVAMALERVRLIAELQQRAEALAEMNRIKDEFLAIVSHELRTPLNAILGWSRLLRTRELDPATIARALETIERNAKSQAQLIEDLLDVSRIIRGKLRLQVRPVELLPVIEAAIDAIRPAADAKNIQLESALTKLDPVLGDPDRLQQVVWNLLSNAVKFTPEGGRIQVRLQQIGSHAQIQVSDTGQGIRANFLPYVFDQFRQADSSTTRVHGGIGLGLAIVRNLVELHGGTVSVASQGEGQGSTFTVELPLQTLSRPGSDSPLNSLQAAEIMPNPALALSNLQILVVEDDPDARDFLTTVLEQGGARVNPVASVREAMVALEKFEPDVLVSDIGMPGEDGYALIDQVKVLEAEQERQIPAIALTAYATEDDRRRVLSAGFQLHMPKPIEPDDLVEAIANLAEQAIQDESSNES